VVHLQITGFVLVVKISAYSWACPQCFFLPLIFYQNTIFLCFL
jgi:hypothetical protein